MIQKSGESFNPTNHSSDSYKTINNRHLLKMKNILVFLFFLNIVLVNAQTEPPGNTSMYFDGVDDYMTVENNQYGYGSFTYEFWIKTKQSGNPVTDWRNGVGLIMAASANGNGEELGISLSQGKILFGLSSGGTAFTISSTKIVNDNKWHHVTTTRNQSTSAVAIYIDGQLDASGASSVNNNPDEQDLVIGHSLYANTFFNGQLCEIKMFNVEKKETDLPGDIINTNVTALNLEYYWRFEEDLTQDNPTTAINLKGNSIELLLKNGPLWALRVTNNVDNAAIPGTLRWAINQANSDTDKDYIDFSFPSAGEPPFTISLFSDLPEISNPAIVDGYSQYGAKANTLAVGNDADLRVVIDGNNLVSNCLSVTAGNTIIKGLVINNASTNQIKIGGANNSILGNFIGTDYTGTSSGTTLGNTNGIWVTGADALLIGTVANADRNVISGNGGKGITVTSGTAVGPKIYNNYIGTSKDGITPMGSQEIGVDISGTEQARSVNLGGTAANTGNVIGGNTKYGVYLSGDCRGNVIWNNKIGLGADGTANVGNGTGIYANTTGTASTNNIGSSGAANSITNNTNDGVIVDGARNILIQTNKIYCNGAGNGITLKDGANNGQAVPDILVATPTTISGTAPVNSTIDIYRNTTSCTATQGETWVTAVTADAVGAWSYTGTFILGEKVSATSTNAVTGTSEFEATVVAAAACDPLVVTLATDNFSGAGGECGDLRYAITAANLLSTAATITFDIQVGAFPYTIDLKAPLPNLINNSGITIDGFSQPGSSANTLSVFDATTTTPMNAVYGIVLGNVANIPVGINIPAGSKNNVIKGLVLQDFGDGSSSNNDIAINIDGNNNQVLGCILGLDATGLIAGTKTAIGIEIGGNNNIIGDGTPAGANLISGLNSQYACIEIVGSATAGNTINGNMIGLLKDGTTKTTGAMSSTGISLASGANVVTGNVISGRYFGINIGGSASATSNQIKGNIIGTQANGLSYVSGNTQERGISITTAGNTIGGSTSIDRNIISGNENSGVHLSGNACSTNLVKGNYIGLDKTGTAVVAGSTQDYGVYITNNASGNTIGGDATANEGNVISGNSNTGIYTTSTNANTILGNYIGTQANGISPLAGNTQAFGIALNGVGHVVGGSNPANRNIISGNSTSGITINGPAAANNSIKGNYIGLDVTGSVPVAQSTGISISTANGLTAIGGSNAGEGNVISGNTTAGINITNSITQPVTIEGNFIGLQKDGISRVVPDQQPIGVNVGGRNVVIGGSNVGQRNIISGNTIGGILLDGNAANNVVKGNYIGLGKDGVSYIAGNSQDYGVELKSTQANSIGGVNPGEGNVISGNISSGIYINSVNPPNTVQGNIIGLQADGMSFVTGSAQLDGINSSGKSAIIGGNTPAARNIISGNETSGINLQAGSNTNVIQGNYIGTDKIGKSIQNGATVTGCTQDNGIYIGSTLGSNIVGGNATLGEGNVISGNFAYGIWITSPAKNTITGNIVGPQADGITALIGNKQQYGINVGASNQLIGETSVGKGNMIALNNMYGIYAIGVTKINNKFSGNSIFSNTTKGININYGPTAANGGKVVPVITSTTTTTISGTGTDGDTIEVFSNAAPFSGKTQGKTYLKSTFVSGGVWSISGTFTSGDSITATATDAVNGSSEFSVSRALPYGNSITTSAILPTALCVGSNLTVNYTPTGTFNAGNTFTVQLSNTSGSFVATPTTLGSVTATTATPITVVIPNLAGTGYKIRVVSSNPAVNGSENVTPLSIVALPVVNVGTTVSTCAGEPATLGGSPTASGGAVPYTYTWSPTTNLSSSTIANPIFSSTVPGSYPISLSVTDVKGCTSTGSVVVTNNITPTVTMLSTQNVCTDAVLVNVSTGVSALNADNYIWSSTGNGSFVPDNFSLGASYVPSVSDIAQGTVSFSLVGISPASCTSPAASKTLNFMPLPTIAGSTTVAVGGTTQLTGSGGGTWSSVSISVATVSSSGLVTGNTAGTSVITYTDANGCTSTTTITVFTLATQPVGNRGMYFDGVDDFIAVNSPVQNNFTIEFWMKTTQSGNPGANAKWFYGYGLVDGDAGSYDYGVSLADGKIRFGTGDSGFDYTAQSTTLVNDNKWHHIAVTRNQVTGAVAMYIDGVSETLTGNLTQAVGALTGTSTLKIGKIQSNQFPYNGQMDEIKIFNAIRTQSEIASDMSSSSTSTAGLVSYWNFEDDTAAGDQTIATDVSINTNDGTLTNDPLWALRVTNVLDSIIDIGSLRWVINEANSDMDQDYIDFSIQQDGTISVIQPLSTISISEPVYLDGYSAFGSNVNTNPFRLPNNSVLKVEFDASKASTGTARGQAISLGTSNSILAGFAVHGGNFPVGIGGSNNSVRGCYSGLKADGTTGGQNDKGWAIDGTAQIIGWQTVPNPAAANIFSNTDYYGLVVNSDNTVISGNYFGTNKTGNVPVYTNRNSIFIQSGSGNTIHRNLLTGNRYEADLRIDYGPNTITGNLIGLNADSLTDLTDADYGIGFAHNTGQINILGGDAIGQSNTIAYHTLGGINLASGETPLSKQIIRQNKIYCNGNTATGIINSPVTQPTLSGTIFGGTTTLNIGNLDATDTKDIYFYKNTSCGKKQGEVFVTKVAAVASGLGTYIYTGTGFALGDVVTVMYISSNGSSVFSDSLLLTKPNTFNTTWKTTVANESITIPTLPLNYTYNYSVDWGDGNITTGNTGDATHTYALAGTHQVSIFGTFPRIHFNDTGDKDKIQSIDQWGDIAWASMLNAFNGCSNLGYTAKDAPNLSGVTDFTGMFSGCTSFVGNVSMSNWNTGTITTTLGMFVKATVFNADISGWNTSAVKNMSNMFYLASAFNQPIGSWNTISVTDMSSMFADAGAFDQPIGNWNTASVNTMQSMFISTKFNQDISGWNTGAVTNMRYMFRFANLFNKPLGSWNTANVTTLELMFSGATAFNQNLKNWTITGVTNMANMLDGTALSVANYDSTLIAWSSQAVKPNVALGALGLKYCAAAIQRNSLISSKTWTITDAGLACATPIPTVTAATLVSKTGFTANWNKTGAASYDIDISTTSNFASGVTTFSAIADTFYVATGLAANTVYYYRVRNTGDVTPSNTKMTSTILPPGSGNGLKFDGITNYISVLHNQSLNFGTGDFSMEAWVKRDKSGVRMDVISKNQITSNASLDSYYQMVIENNDKVFVYTSNGGTNETTVGTTTIPVNQWMHLIATRSGTSMKIYVNGVLDGTGTSTHNVNSTDNLHFGTTFSSSSVPNSIYSGSLDEIKLWNKALSQTEIQNQMCKKLTGFETGLVSYFRLDENTGTITENKAKGSTVDGSIVGSPNWTYSGAPIGDVSKPEYTTGISSVSFTDTVKLTIDNFTLAANQGIQVYKVNEAPSQTGLGTSLNGLHLKSYFGVFPIGITDYKVTYDYTSTNINNQPQESSLTFANRADNSIATWNKIANTTLDMVNNAVATPNAPLLTGRTEIIGAFAPPPIRGAALDFDGVNDVVTVTNGSAMFANQKEITMEGWFFIIDNDTIEGLLGIRDVNKSNYWIAKLDDGRIQARIITDDATANLDISGVDLNIPHHYALVYDSKKMIFYIDGVMKGTPQDLTGIISETNIPFYIGYNFFTATVGSNWYLKGYVDEVRIWSRALCEAEIKNNMNCEKPSNQVGLLARYDFNQGIAGGNNSVLAADKIAIDSSVNNNHGTLSGFDLNSPTSNWVAPGKIVSGSACPTLVLPPGTIWTWTGAVSTDWFSPCNWDMLSVPNVNSSVDIPGAITPNQPLITGAGNTAKCKNLEIKYSSGANLELNSSTGAKLEVKP